MKGDDTKCTGCGEPFVSGSGPYIRTGFPGMYHKRCLPHGPDPDQYHAGLIAGLREAAEKLEKRIEEVLAWMDANGDGINDRDNPRSVALLTLNVAQQDIRARIAALEAEEGKK